MGELETLKEAGSRGAGLRVLIGKRMGASYTSDLTPEGIQQMVRSAIDLAALTTEDPHAGLPDAEETGFARRRSAALLRRNREASRPKSASTIAKRAEAAALAVDPRITNSEGASFDSSVGGRVFANSRGFLGSYRSSYCSISAVPVATQNGSMERDYWFTIARNYQGTGRRGDGGAQGGGARAAAAGRGEGGDAARPGDLRAAHGPHTAGQHLRSRQTGGPSTGRRRSSPGSWARRSPTNASR